MEPNFKEMGVADLREYVLNNRQNKQAIQALFTHPSIDWKSLPPMFAEDGTPIEENIRIVEEAIREQATQERKKEAEKKIERNFKEMGVGDLREYVLNNPENKQAIQALFSHPSIDWKSLPPIFAEDGTPIPENLHIVEEAILQQATEERKQEAEKKIEPNFKEMGVADLREYLQNNRQNKQAIQALFSHPSIDWKSLPPIFAEDGTPIEENLRIVEQAIREQASQERKQEAEKKIAEEKKVKAQLRAELADKLEAKLRSKLEKELELQLNQLEKKLEAKLRAKLRK